jgi:hypothetical protein
VATQTTGGTGQQRDGGPGAGKRGARREQRAGRRNEGAAAATTQQRQLGRRRRVRPQAQGLNERQYRCHGSQLCADREDECPNRLGHEPAPIHPRFLGDLGRCGVVPYQRRAPQETVWSSRPLGEVRSRAPPLLC